MRKGFTLIELMVVIAIISLLSSIVFANLSNVRNKAIIAAGQLFEGNVNAKIGDGLIAEYNFDEDVTNGNLISDTSGNNNNLTLVSATRSAGGANRNAISMSDTYQNAQGFLNNFNPDEGALSFWVKPTEFTLGPQFPIFSVGSKQGDTAYHAYVSFNMQGTESFPGLWNCGKGWIDYKTLVTSAKKEDLLGRWNHVLISWTIQGSPQVYVYLNGKLIGQQIYNDTARDKSYFFFHDCGTQMVTIPGSPVWLYLGTGNQGRYATFSMDRIRIYNKPFLLTN